MTGSFMYGWPRRDERGTELYSDQDLRFGIDFALGYMSEGDTHDVKGMPLKEFAEWCARQLYEI